MNSPTIGGPSQRSSRQLTPAFVRELISRETIQITDERICRNPLLSVAFVTYNHIDFVEQSVSSILSQTTSFPFEIVIADDGSTDGTAELLSEIQRAHPDKVVLLLARSNMGHLTGNGRINLIRCLNHCRAEFVARLEGDDFWTNAHKLELQVRYLTNNPDCSACHHRVQYINESGKHLSQLLYPFWKSKISINELLQHPTNLIATSSIVYRKSCFPNVPEALLNVGLMDWPMSLVLATKGKIGLINKTMSCYRSNSSGIWSQKSLRHRSWNKLKALKATEAHLHLDNSPTLRRLFVDLRLDLAKGLKRDGMPLRGRRLQRIVWRKAPISVARSICRRQFNKLCSYAELLLRRNFLLIRHER